MINVSGGILQHVACFTAKYACINAKNILQLNYEKLKPHCTHVFKIVLVAIEN